MPEFTVTFNGHDITEYLTVLDLNRGMQLGRSSRIQSRNDKKGVQFLGTSSYLNVIPMRFRMAHDLINKRRELARILNVNEPKPLIFSDEPNRVYYAIPAGDINVDERSFVGVGTINWEVPEGVSYALQETNFFNGTIDNLSDVITIDNPGTEPMELDLRAEFFSDNGFFGIENDTGESRALFGDMDEVDGFTYEASEMLFNDHLYTNQGWTANNGIVPPVAPNMRQQGSFSYVEESAGEGFARVVDYGPAGPTWTGPSLTKEIPADENGEYPVNFTSSFRVDFNPDGAGSSQSRARNVGHQAITFADEQDRIIVSVVIEDNTSTAEKSDLAIYIGNRRVFDSRNTSSYYVTARPRQANHIRVEKMGNEITIELAFINQKLTYTAENPDAELRKVTFYAARFGVHQPMHNNLLRALNVIKHNVSRWQDIPNKFQDGDILRYGKGGRNVFCLLNDMNELRMRDVGSTLLSAPPGRSHFYIMYSDFSATPRVRLRGRAKYV
jgi:predicted phage tail component-like protein